MYHKNNNLKALRFIGVTLVFTLGVLGTIGSNGGGGGCGGGGGGGGPDVLCSSTNLDSEQTPTGWNRIHSEASATYYQVTLTRQTTGTGPAINMDYMVHEPPATPLALIVLIAGGQLNANIQPPTTGLAPSFAGGNFLVRSAHLFAAQGYRVLTIDRPSDNQDYILGSGSGYAYDGYRTAMEHAVDLSELINIVNTTNLPVIIAGTSRGSISAVAQHELGTALAISAPLTGGANGTPIGTGNVLPANVSDPVHISWHELDGCSSTTPADAQALVSDFSDATGVSIGGGFASVASISPCNADHYHGFPGIESCAVQQATDWLAVELTSLPATRPTTVAVADTTALNTPTSINLSGAATGAIPGSLTYSLPHATTSLGGTISIAGTSVSYTPPNGVSGIVDTFVYVVDEAGGGTSHNVVAVSITP